MKTSARNVFNGTVTALKHGSVNAEVELTVTGGDKIVAIVTEESVRSLGIEVDKPATALFKAPWVMLFVGDTGMRLSARNQFQGTISKVVRGAINTEVAVKLAGGTVITAVITNEAADELAVKEGLKASALIKASHVVLGTPI